MDHFGDKDAAEAEECCDNCLAKRRKKPPQSVHLELIEKIPQSEPENIGLIILDCVSSLSGKFQKMEIVNLLTGSDFNGIESLKLTSIL